MAYITLSNAYSVILKTNIKSLGDIRGNVYKIPIYFFNKYEEAQLIAIQELLKDPEKFFTEFYKPIERKDTYSLVYEGTPPSYHKNIDCLRMKSDFRNFEIPEEIKEKGVEEVTIFRKWFIENRHLLEKPKVFVAMLQARWGIVTNPKSLFFDNTGYYEIHDYSIEELETEIDKLIKSAGRFYYQDEKNKIILRRYSKLAHMGNSHDLLDKNDTGFSDEDVKEILQYYNEAFKKPLKKMLVEFYRLKLNPDINFKATLLETLGFKPCRLCHSNEQDHQDNFHWDSLIERYGNEIDLG